MLSIIQGNSSDLIKVINEQQDLSEDGWEAKILIVKSLNNLFPIFEKEMYKNKEMKCFLTLLKPEETNRLFPGKYIFSVILENKIFNYRKEKKETLVIKQKINWK